MTKYKKGQVWNKAKNQLMKDFEKTGKNAVYKGKITGQFEYWLWQKEKQKAKSQLKAKKPATQARKPRQTTRLSTTNKEKIKKLQRKISKLEDEYGKNPSEQYDIGNEIEKLRIQLSKLQKLKKPPTPKKSKGTPITREMKIQDTLKWSNPIAVGVIIEEDDIIYFRSGKTNTPFKVVEKKIQNKIPMIQLRNLKTGRLTKESMPEFDYLDALKSIDKKGVKYKKLVKIPEATTWNTLSQKRRMLFLYELSYTLEFRNKYVKVNFKQLPSFVQKQLSFHSKSSGIDYIANMKMDTFNNRYDRMKDIESREKDNYYCLECKRYHYEGRGKLYNEHKKLAKKDSKKPLLKVHIGKIRFKDLDIRLRKLIREYKNGINNYYIKEEIKQDFLTPKEYHPSYLVMFYVKAKDRDPWKKYGQMGWMWVPEEHKFMEY